MKLLIIGGRGFLGQLVQRKFKALNTFELFTPTSEQVDFTNLNTASICVKSINPDLVLNLSALTDVDYCQNNIQESYLKNMAIVENLKKIKNQKNFYLVHISTDHVYDAKEKFDQSKVDQLNLKNVYALTKYAGELSLINDPSAVVLRTNFFGKSISAKRSFTDWLFESAEKNAKISLFEDITFSPLHTSTLISIIESTLDQRISGTFNTGSRKGLSKAEFSKFFLSKVQPHFTNYDVVESAVIGNRAPRPKHMIMDSGNLESALGIKLDTTYEEVEKALGEYK
jgi:dTDP-4-dehydrorhamnose reductase